MANPPKQQGTRRESALVARAHELGFKAQRSPNNAPSRDVDMDIGDVTLRVEVKDRQRLSVHDTVNDMVAANEGCETALYWHRYVKKKGNSRRTSVGSVWVLPEPVMERMLTALAVHCPDWADVEAPS